MIELVSNTKDHDEITKRQMVSPVGSPNTCGTRKTCDFQQIFSCDSKTVGQQGRRIVSTKNE